MGGGELCRNDPRYTETLEIQVVNGRFVNRAPANASRKTTVKVKPWGASCALQWHEELVTTAASPYDVMTTIYKLEAKAGVVSGTGRRSERTMGMGAPHCREKLLVRGTLQPFVAQDFELDVGAVRKDLQELLAMIPDFCRKDSLPNLEGPLSIDLTIAKRGGLASIVINGKPYPFGLECQSILSSNKVQLFKNPARVRKKVHIDMGEALAAARGAAEPMAALPSEEDANHFLERWVEAQNRGRFEDYAALYADSFTGIRRSGAQIKRLDRGGWMAERRRMFARPMTVEIAEVVVSGTRDSRKVELTQTWSSGTYEDVGRKRLLLRREAGAWRIAAEEMLTSHITPSR